MKEHIKRNAHQYRLLALLIDKVALEPLATAALLIVCTALIINGSFNPFLYFRF